MGFCLIWKLRILQRVLGFVFWSWAFGLAFFNESSLMGFCWIWKLGILPRVLGFVFWSWAFGPAFFLMSLLGWVSVQSERCWSYHEFLDLSFEAGPSAQLFLKRVFLDGFLFNLKVKDLTTSSWICLLKLGLRPSVFLMNLLGWVSV